MNSGIHPLLVPPTAQEHGLFGLPPAAPPAPAPAPSLFGSLGRLPLLRMTTGRRRPLSWRAWLRSGASV
jgi:hypothetical protein